jgi:hypothetical protein
MRWHHWFRNTLGQLQVCPVYRPRPPGRAYLRPRLERFEDRTLLASYTAASVKELINDISVANKGGGANTITLTAATTSPYVLTAVDNMTDGPTGLPVIRGGTKADNLTIVGNGDTIERSTVSGTPGFRLLDVANGGSLTLENLTLENGLEVGSGVSAEGGAVINQGTLTLMGVTVQNNIAEGSTGVNGTKASPSGGDGATAFGGGIWSYGALTLEDLTLASVVHTTIANNQAIGGVGGAAVAGCKNYTNAVSGGSGGGAGGGGVYVLFGTANVTNASLFNNTAEGGQGGSGSQAYAGGPGGDAGGGGLVAANGSATLSGTTLMSNVAQAGQGGAGGTGCSGNTTPLAGFGGNGGFAFGGGLQLEDGITGVVSNDMVDGNQAVAGLGGSGSTPGYGGRAFGGGLYLAGSMTQSTTVTLSNTTIESNTAPNSPGNPYGGEGGGIYVQDATVTLCNDTVEFNTATLGGGIYIIESEPGPTVSIGSSTVVSNNTDSSGTNGSTANIDGSYFTTSC